MERFNINTVKSLLGRNVNLHLKDGSVIVNVVLAEIQKDKFRRKVFVKCIPYGRKRSLKIPLRNINRADLLNLNLIHAIGL